MAKVDSEKQRLANRGTRLPRCPSIPRSLAPLFPRPLPSPSSRSPSLTRSVKDRGACPPALYAERQGLPEGSRVASEKCQPMTLAKKLYLPNKAICQPELTKTSIFVSPAFVPRRRNVRVAARRKSHAGRVAGLNQGAPLCEHGATAVSPSAKLRRPLRGLWGQGGSHSRAGARGLYAAALLEGSCVGAIETQGWHPNRGTLSATSCMRTRLWRDSVAPRLKPDLGGPVG